MNNKYGPAPKSMDFGEAIGTCLKKYFVFEGRASKSEFWYFFLAYAVGSFILEIGFQSTQSPALGIILGIVAFGGMIPSVSAACRRLHDINKSGWWQLIPIYNLILWTQDSSSGTSQSRSGQYTQTRSSRSRDYSEAPRSRSGKNDLTDELDELQALYEDGTLSEAQFKKAKKKILG
tara:strand:- start:801 stop:1331 length:531 start_codon:yes stop_codon:yes gene_type:complete